MWRRAVRTTRPATPKMVSRNRFGPATRSAPLGEALGVRDQVGGQHRDLEPHLVGRGVVEGQVAQPGVLGADAALDAGVAAVPQLECGQVIATAVGEEPGDPVHVGVGEPQLRTRTGAFLAHDQPGARRPG